MIKREAMDPIPLDVNWPLLMAMVMREGSYTQASLAGEIGCAVATVQRVLDGKREPERYAHCARLLTLAHRLLSERQIDLVEGRITLEELEAAERFEVSSIPVHVDIRGLVLALREKRITLDEIESESGLSRNVLGMICQGRVRSAKLNQGLALVRFARRALTAESYAEHVRHDGEEEARWAA
mgnify:CR=1 FL=1